uniref:hypothetical protein n=1 Tax=Erythrolobus coxiae TaxID=362235 RepID=UPI001FCDA7A7|nr:hypothetical protein MW556_pgp014 [Erythrolobus coxiae]UNJ17793.1 hypothetical protein [Erythrolobus coxiae]
MNKLSKLQNSAFILSFGSNKKIMLKYKRYIKYNQTYIFTYCTKNHPDDILKYLYTNQYVINTLTADHYSYLILELFKIKMCFLTSQVYIRV